MSAIEYVTYFEKKEIHLTELNPHTIIKLEDTCREAVIEKLKKLNIIIKNCNVYVYKDTILVNDRHKICKDLTEIATAFGFYVCPINCSLKGNNYLIGDNLLHLYKQLGKKESLIDFIANKDLDDTVREIIDNNLIDTEINKELLEIINNIRNNGSYKLTVEREVTDKLDDGMLMGSSYGDWTDTTSLSSKLSSLSRRAEKIINQTNLNIQQGTSKLIYSRARQMGYAVEEKAVGDEIQLVLVRLN